MSRCRDVVHFSYISIKKNLDLHFRVPFYTFRDVTIMSVDHISNTVIKVSHWKMKHSVTFPVSGLVGDISKSVFRNTFIVFGFQFIIVLHEFPHFGSIWTLCSRVPRVL